jgi:cobalt/nickel transport system permease protein
MIKAFKSRGGGFIKNMSRQSQIFAEIFALVFIRSYDRAERVNKAMEARGYDGKYTASTEVPQIKTVEFVFLLILLVTVVYMLLVYSPQLSR